MIRTLIFLVLALTLSCVASLHLGLRVYAPETVWSALNGGASTEEIIIRTLRVPRTIIGALTGAALAISGLLMQSVTRNPLAEPGLLGINAGAAFAVTVGLTVFALSSPLAIGALAVIGALIATALVFGFGLTLGPSGNTGPILLIGVTIAALLASLTQVMLLLDETALETLLFWLSGGFADRPLIMIWGGAIALPVALIACASMASGIDALRLDDQSAQGIGVGVTRIRLAALTLAALLAAAAVAMAGPVVFLGLIAPHIARRISDGSRGFFHLALITMLCGAVLAVLADILARLIVAPGEAPISAVLALVGAPFLMYLLRSRRAVAL
ncbi:MULTISPECIES: FecCD family ABC transporter permease [Halocynthiibacter]|uniref:Iron ABC transporter permease n=1 Tax=Halocynthiibacter halioticoli TaxID=2986804 RepID=A0AAE3IZI1_9RHOB|nr:MULTISPECIES: iron ABC transporter permease [Halocynthiibacter]MCV6824554.1 iron ABC transporter permease [Halocynthiibacter halioticoli]MCW4057555.1 iron ABC transporter permease [Halocynthiibacter sp. SDUM655004]